MVSSAKGRNGFLLIPPAPDNLGDDPISAVVQITTDLPRKIPRSILTPYSLMTLKQMAVLGAMIVENERCFIGSRLTAFENESAWNLHIPFLLFATIAGSDSHLEAIQTVLGTKEPATGKSAWTADDFQALHSALSDFSVSTTGDLSVTAEFGLRPGAESAAVGDHMTALLQLDATSPTQRLAGVYFVSFTCHIALAETDYPLYPLSKISIAEKCLLVISLRILAPGAKPV